MVPLVGQAAAAEFLALGFFCAGYAVARRFFRAYPVSVRWSVAVLAAWTAATLAFHLLMALRQFNVGAALVVVALLVVAVHAGLLRLPEFLREVAADVGSVLRLGSWHRHGWRIVPAVVFGFCVVLTAAKTLLIPPLGWDALTYHATKAALWVQSGGPATLPAPGGWSCFALYPGGAESVLAWAMLPFHSDLLAPFSTALVWVSTGLVVYAGCGVLGLSRWNGLMTALFVLFVPTVHRAAGACTIEPMLALATAGVLLAGSLYFQSREPAPLVLGLALLGVMAGIKIHGLILAAFGAAIFLAGVLGDPSAGRAHLKWYLAGGLLALLAVAPWWVHTARLSGYPLSPIPVKLLGITLGQENGAVAWIGNQPNVVSNWRTELGALAQIFSFSEAAPRLGPFMLLPVLLFPAGIAAIARRNRWAAWLAVVLAAGALLGYFHPAMTAVRLRWIDSNSRFLLPLVPLAAVVAAVAFRDHPRLALLYSLTLGAATLIHAAREVFWGVAGPLPAMMPLLALLLVVLGIAVVRLSRTAAAAVCAAALVPLVLLPPLAVFRDAMRNEVYSNEKVMVWHYTLRYWSQAARLLDRPGSEVRIAVTSAPWQNHDNWMAYALLGRRFQNRLLYVPISGSGEILPFDGTENYQQGADYETWRARLLDQRVDYVMSFWPPSIERLWMQGHPDAFAEVSSGEKWGCYRVVADR